FRSLRCLSCFFFHSFHEHRHLPSFPTRRSSDLAVLYLVLRWFEHRQVYHPYRELEASGGELGRPFEDVTFRTADRLTLHGWFFRSEEHTSELQSRGHLVCRLLLEKKK